MLLLVLKVLRSCLPRSLETRLDLKEVLPKMIQLSWIESPVHGLLISVSHTTWDRMGVLGFVARWLDACSQPCLLSVARSFLFQVSATALSGARLKAE